MDTQEKIESFKEILEIKTEFQLDILRKVLSDIEQKVKIDTEDPRPSEEYHDGEKAGFKTCLNDVKYLIENHIKMIRHNS